MVRTVFGAELRRDFAMLPGRKNAERRAADRVAGPVARRGVQMDVLAHEVGLGAKALHPCVDAQTGGERKQAAKARAGANRAGVSPAILRG